MYKFLLLFLTILYIVPLTFVVGDYIFEYMQLLVILSAFFIPTFTLNTQRPNIVDYNNYLIASDKLLTYILFSYLFFKINTIIELFNHLIIYKDYAEWTLNNAIERYSGVTEKSIWFKISTIMFITYSFLLGSYNYKRKNKYLFIFIYLFMIFIESSELARAGILIGFTSLITELLIRNNKFFYQLQFYTYIKYGFIVIISLLIIFLFSAYFRVAGKDDVVNILLLKLSQYTIAMYKALLIWMHETQTYGDTYGYSTFTSFYKLFGIKAQQGFYYLVQTEYGATNIYTTLRGLLSDFGIMLSFIIFLVMGFFIKYFSFKSMNVYSYFLIRFFIFLLIYILYSPFLFFTVTIAFIFSYFLLLVDNHKIRIRNKNAIRKS